MQLLLDTHTLIWALEDNPKLKEEARDLITDIKNQIFVSIASLWEIAIKKSVKKNFPYNPETIINLCSRIGFRFLGIGIEEIKKYGSLSVKKGCEENKDPFDKILAIQAKNNKMMFLTHDHIFKAYDEPCIIVF